MIYYVYYIILYYWPWTNDYSTWNDVFPKLAFQSQISCETWFVPDGVNVLTIWGFRWRRWAMANQVILKWWAQISTCTFWEETLFPAPPFWWRVISKPPCWQNDFGHGTTAACRGGHISSIQNSKQNLYRQVLEFLSHGLSHDFFFMTQSTTTMTQEGWGVTVSPMTYHPHWNSRHVLVHRLWRDAAADTN